MKVAVIIGSPSDRQEIGPCLATLAQLGIEHELRILSAHRTPDELARYVDELTGRGVGVVIAGAGLSAHLAGTVAARVTLPVIGVPMEVGPLKGLDALLSTVQMPAGIPVAAVAIGRAGVVNAALLAARIIALGDGTVRAALERRRTEEGRRVLEADRKG